MDENDTVSGTHEDDNARNHPPPSELPYPPCVEGLHPKRNCEEAYLFRVRFSERASTRTKTRDDREGREGPPRKVNIDASSPSRDEELPRLRRGHNALENIQQKDDVDGGLDELAIVGKRDVVDV